MRFRVQFGINLHESFFKKLKLHFPLLSPLLLQSVLTRLAFQVLVMTVGMPFSLPLKLIFRFKTMVILVRPKTYQFIFEKKIKSLKENGSLGVVFYMEA